MWKQAEKPITFIVYCICLISNILLEILSRFDSIRNELKNNVVISNLNIKSQNLNKLGNRLIYLLIVFLQSLKNEVLNIFNSSSKECSNQLFEWEQYLEEIY